MAKAPASGQTKTRLVPPLTPDEAAAINGAFLSDITANIAEAARTAPIDGWIAYAPAGSERALLRFAAPGTALLRADGDGEFPGGVEGLGRCLLHAAHSLFEQGYGAVCLVNSDSPTLPTSFITAAACRLLGHSTQIVLGPAEDGGYYLIGMSAPHADLFAGITWSTAAVATETRVRVAALGLPLAELDPWYDVDDPISLDRLAAEINRPNPGAHRPYAAPATSDFLKRLGFSGFR